MNLPDLEVEGLDESYRPAWYRRPFWNAIATAIRYSCRIRFAAIAKAEAR